MVKTITDIELCAFLDKFLREGKPNDFPNDKNISFLEDNSDFLKSSNFNSIKNETKVILINILGNTFAKGFIIVDKNMIIKRIKTFSPDEETQVEHYSFHSGFYDGISKIYRHNQLSFLEERFLNYKLIITGKDQLIKPENFLNWIEKDDNYVD